MQRARHGGSQADGRHGTFGDPVLLVEISLGQSDFVGLVEFQLVDHLLERLHQRLHIRVDGLKTSVAFFHRLHIISHGLKLTIVTVQIFLYVRRIGEGPKKDKDLYTA